MYLSKLKKAVHFFLFSWGKKECNKRKMELVADILGPSHEHCFVAKEFLCITWSTCTVPEQTCIASDEELTLLQAVGLNQLCDWKKSHTLDGMNVLFLPLTNESFFLCGTSSGVGSQRCKHVKQSDVAFIIRARRELISRLMCSFSAFTNFDLFEAWPLLKHVQEKLFQ